jgi:hypothetical protein
MNKSLLFCGLFALLAQFAMANHLPQTPPPCNLPAPLSATYTHFGPDWLKLKWETGALPLGTTHRVKTFKLAGNVLVSNLVAPSGTTEIIINGLQSGTQYYSVINAICSDGTESPNTIISGLGGTVISDLIVHGFSDANTPAVCTIDYSNNDCQFTTNGLNYFFRVVSMTNPSFSRQFIIKKEDGKLRGKVTSVGGSYTFKIDGEDPPKQGYVFQIFTVLDGVTTLIATFKLSEETTPNGTGIGHLTATYILSSPNSGYKIERLTALPASLQAPPTQAPAGLDERSEKIVSPLKTTVSPNPFSDQLSLNLEQPAQTPVWLRLLNLSGQVVLEKHFDAGQNMIQVSTAHVSPGFYLLRIEAEGQVQTLKVVKNE